VEVGLDGMKLKISRFSPFGSEFQGALSACMAEHKLFTGPKLAGPKGSGSCYR
jgi:hypothetical protein